MSDGGRVHSLVVASEAQQGKAIPVNVVLIWLAKGKILSPEDIFVSGQDDKDVKHSARRGGWIAYEQLRKKGLIHSNSSIAQSGVTFDFEGNTVNQISGPSAGLCFLVKMTQETLEEYLRFEGRKVPPYNFAATGALLNMSGDTKIDWVEAIEAKIEAALATLGKGGMVFYPKDNDPLDPALHPKAEQKQISLVAVDTPQKALDLILEKYGFPQEGDGNGRPPKPKWRKRILWLCPVPIVALVLWILFWTPPPPCSIKAGLYYEDEESRPVPLPEGKALTKGDYYRVRLELDDKCFLYVLEVDSEDHITWLFPPKPYFQPLPGGVHWIPTDNQWSELDEVEGEEIVLVLASVEQSPSLEEMREKINLSKNLTGSARRELKRKIVTHLKHEQAAQRGTFVRRAFRHD